VIVDAVSQTASIPAEWPNAIKTIHTKDGAIASASSLRAP
jgi:hypothetical protein